VFTGLVEEMAKVVGVESKGNSSNLTLESQLLSGDAAIGDSICINGCWRSMVIN